MQIDASVCLLDHVLLAACCWRGSERQQQENPTRRAGQTGAHTNDGLKRWSAWLAYDRSVFPFRSSRWVTGSAAHAHHSDHTPDAGFPGPVSGAQTGGWQTAGSQAQQPADREHRFQGTPSLRSVPETRGQRTALACPMPCHAMPNAMGDGKGGVDGWKRRNCLAWARRGPRSLFRRFPCLGRGLSWSALPSGHWVAGHAGRSDG